MEISISLIEDKDAEALFQFETENRLFFERMVPSRGDEYYTYETFKVRHQELLNEQESGQSRFYLIKDSEDRILGRINLVEMDEANSTAEIGFRVGAESARKGIANKALDLLLKEELNLKRIHGKTTTVNLASQKVLEKNGFKQVGTGDEEFEMNGQKMKFVYYLRECQEAGHE